ncbi:MAG: MgtC/SapB family protein [Clostridia bacterium]|nr:MgtC/SapB family protein [Clostridia bacterium]
MIPDNFLEILIRLAGAVILGGLVGIERAGSNHDAGLRTHILVCLGAAGIMVMSEEMHIVYGGDIGRIGAQVVSGIGFLGAGCILVNGNRIKGLTTAAGLWTTACVGLSIGMGYYFTSITMVALILLVMLLLRPITSRINRHHQRSDYTLKINCRGGFKTVTKYLDDNHQISSVTETEDGFYIVKFSNQLKESFNQFVFDLMEDEDIKSVEKI